MLSFNKFLRLLDKRANGFGTQYKAFGIFGLINYPASYFILYYLGSQTNEDFTIRLVATILCLPLALVHFWPAKAKTYLNLYWFLIILYCLPFLGTYMLLKNHISSEWLMNETLGFFLFILLVDWLVFVTLLVLGIVLGYLVFIGSGQVLTISPHSDTAVFFALHTYIYAVGLGLIFSHIFHRGRLQSMKLLAGAIAHELRTPLSAISMTSQILKGNIPSVIDGYKKAKAANLPVDDIDEDYMEQVSEEIDLTTRNAFGIIDMLLMNLKDVSEKTPPETCSMNACIKNALASYPMTAEEKSLVHFEAPGHDFSFEGNDLFMRHVLFNLLKNALHYVKAANKGAIFIRTKEAPKENLLIFKDTGMGMPASMVPHVFDRFYSRTQHGTGIGLAFCKSVLEGIGGKITCQSVEGEHTTFILSIPKVS